MGFDVKVKFLGGQYRDFTDFKS